MPRLRPLPLALILPALAVSLFARDAVMPAPEPPPPGFQERVVCQSDAAQTYALFLPTTYDPARPWPVLFCFDPRGRGDLPVRLFAAAAEARGYIVAGSYNSRNGPLPDNAAAAAAVLRDVGERYSVDRTRVYAAGFSGGARVATNLGAAGLVHAVIACGGGFLDPENTPPRLPFDLIGFAGTDDFNRPELVRIESDLKGTFAAHRLVVFPGGHDWLPASSTFTALEWLEARHRHAGVRARYHSLAVSLLQRRQAALASLPPRDQYLEGMALLASGPAWFDVAPLRRQRRQWEKALPNRTEARTLERRQSALFRDWVQQARRGDPAAASVFEQWRHTSTAQPGAEALVTRSALAAAALRCFEETILALAEDRIAPDALRWSKLALAVQPDAPLLAYNHACVAALAGQPAEAATLLGPLVRDDVITRAELERDPAFAAVLRSPEFQPLVAPPAP